jgi:hypothetical protein
MIGELTEVEIMPETGSAKQRIRPAAALLRITRNIALRALFAAICLVALAAMICADVLVWAIMAIALPAYRLGRQSSICSTCDGDQYVTLPGPTYAPCRQCNADAAA